MLRVVGSEAGASRRGSFTATFGSGSWLRSDDEAVSGAGSVTSPSGGGLGCGDAHEHSHRTQSSRRARVFTVANDTPPPARGLRARAVSTASQPRRARPWGAGLPRVSCPVAPTREPRRSSGGPRSSTRWAGLPCCAKRPSLAANRSRARTRRRPAGRSPRRRATSGRPHARRDPPGISRHAVAPRRRLTWWPAVSAVVAW
jgi:hypothetical protein